MKCPIADILHEWSHFPSKNITKVFFINTNGAKELENAHVFLECIYEKNRPIPAGRWVGGLMPSDAEGAGDTTRSRMVSAMAVSPLSAQGHSSALSAGNTQTHTHLSKALLA